MEVLLYSDWALEKTPQANRLKMDCTATGRIALNSPVPS
jgi:hypothetical protein